MTKREFAEFMGVLMEETGRPHFQVTDQAEELEQLAGRIARRAVRQCNEPLTEAQNARIERADARDYERADDIAVELGLPAVLRQSDARGYAIKLMLPKTGRYNSFGGPECGYGIG